MRKIIINADDYGLNKNFNLGIIELLKKGIVSSVSVMIDQKFVFPKELLDIKNISIGLHLEESEFSNFEKQIKKFIKFFGQKPSHLDGHLHCHLKAENRAKIIKLAKKYKLSVRSRFKIDRIDFLNSSLKTPERFMDWHPNKKDNLFRRLRDNKKIFTELVCHPGYFDEKYNKRYNRQREAEIKVLKSKKFENLLKKYHLISYKQL